MRRLILLVTVAVVVGACGGGEPTSGYGYPYPQHCPAGEAARASQTIDTRTLVNQSIEDAEKMARQYGCRLDVVSREQHARPNRPARRIIRVEARAGHVTRIVAVGEP